MIIDTNAILSKVKAIFKSNDDGLALFPNATEAICASLADLNCTYNVERNDQNKDKVIYFKYQGMNFRAFTFSADDNDNCNLDYHAGVYRFEDLEYLRQVTNNANSSVSPIHFYFIADTKDNFYNLYATATLTNVTEISNLSETLNLMLEQLFFAQRSFDDTIKKKKDEAVDDEDDLFMSQHEVWMTREMEINLQLKDNLLKNAEASTLLLTDFLESVYGIQSVEIEYIDVCSNEQNAHITDTEQIHSYLLLQPVVSVDNKEKTVAVVSSTATVSIFYVQRKGNLRSVVLTFRVENDEKNAVYVRVSALREGDCIALDNLWGNTRNKPKAVSLLLAVDKANETQKRAEVKYMWEEAQKKKESGEQLTEDEIYLVRIAAIPQLGDSAYWGRKLFNQKRYAEALNFFENVNNYLEDNFFEDFWTDDVREFFARNCYYLSFCHCELGASQLGVYYAEKACLIFPCPLHTMNFIKAMFKANDFRLFHEIRLRMEEIENIGSKLKEGESLNETQAEMYDFLQQCFALALIRFRKWDEARQRLNMIIDQAPDQLKEWAKEKLEEIKDKK